MGAENPPGGEIPHNNFTLLQDEIIRALADEKGMKIDVGRLQKIESGLNTAVYSFDYEARKGDVVKLLVKLKGNEDLSKISFGIRVEDPSGRIKQGDNWFEDVFEVPEEVGEASKVLEKRQDKMHEFTNGHLVKALDHFFVKGPFNKKD